MAIFYYVRRARKLRYYIHSFYWKSAVEQMVVFKMHDSVPSARYSPVCNVLHLWRICLIPTYIVYRLYDTKFYKFPKYSKEEYGTCQILVPPF